MNHTLQSIGIVGAGAMGRGIAQICAAAGCDVLLLDTQPVAVERAREAVRQDLEQAVARGRLSGDESRATLARIRGAAALAELAACDLVVEAIVERLEAKQQLLHALEAVVSRECILATNTSSLSVTAIASACEHPARVAGWHFFNPVPRMRVVEVIIAPRTAPEVGAALVALSTRVGHRAIETSDSPGFVVNHAGRAFVTEGLKLLAERCAEPETLDAILRECAGFRMGPLELLDLTGLDVSVPVMESIHTQYYGDDRYRPAAFARTRLLAGLLGRKSGQGFYRYDEGAAHRRANAPDAARRPATASLWWPSADAATPPARLLDRLAGLPQAVDAASADVILLAPLGEDLSACASRLGIDATRAVALDPLFCERESITVMTCPATRPSTVASVLAAFASASISSFVIHDSPGFVAPRVVACIVNLACEMAQQGVATPDDIDAAVRLGLGYPQGPFEWGDAIGARRILAILEGLHATFLDPRYRPSPWLVRRARLGLSLSAPERAAEPTH